MEELRRGLWLFGFGSPKEARRILREGTGSVGGLPISLRVGERKSVVKLGEKDAVQCG